MADQILRDCPKRYDPWSKKLMHTYKLTPQGLTNPDLRAELRTTSMHVRRETARLECRHASIRRALVASSAQTHRMLLTHVSGERTCQDFRKWARSRKPTQGSPSKPKAKPTTRRAKPKRASNFGGAWRAFIRQEMFGQRGSANSCTLPCHFFSFTGSKFAFSSIVAKDRI